MSQCDRDLACLTALLGEDDCPEAFVDMADRLEGRPGSILSPKQRRWVNQTARRLHVEPSEGPEDDELAEEPVTRLTAGDVPRGAEVPSMVGALPKRPPARRT